MTWAYKINSTKENSVKKILHNTIVSQIKVIRAQNGIMNFSILSVSIQLVFFFKHES